LLRPAALLLALLALAWPGPAAAEVRTALVVGNGSYRHVPQLDNPLNDARDIAAALEDLDFKVFLGTDLTLDGMGKLLDKFAAQAEKSDVALFYYAGHAFQVDNHNYLVPIDLTLDRPDQVVAQTMSLDRIMEVLQKVPGLRLVFLDACRDNPLKLANESGGGLARVGSAADFLVAYATQPNAVAYDGDGRNGTFSGAVLSHIHTPGQNIADMMIDVRKDVIAATGGQQVPFDSSSLTRQFQFYPGPAGASAETVLYQVAARAQDPDLMRLYLDRFPDGAHVQDVVAFLASAADSGGTQVRGLQGGGGDDGEQLWDLAQRTRLRELYNSYIALYPAGRHLAEAKRLASELPDEDELGPGRQCERLATHPRDATASTAGVPYKLLVQHATEAIQACSSAVEIFPQQPRYVALLARAKAAAGLRDEAVKLYQQAAAQGDLRAMVSLGLLSETGDGVPKDPAKALELYARAADLGSPDGAINLAVALYQGKGIDQDIPRALELFKKASEAGSAIATFNLGVLAQEGAFGQPTDALPLFDRAAREGEPRAYRAAAILLDEGRGVDADPARAAVNLLLGCAADDGAILDGFERGAETWTKATLKELQQRLQEAKLYEGEIDGIAGPQLVAALRAWRNGGFDDRVLSS
jgi:TPR repeat protein